MDESEIKLSEQLEVLKSLVAKGALSEVRHGLQKVPISKLPRELRAKFAMLARRAGLPDLALKWLNPIVRSSSKEFRKANAKENAEYAANLIKIGALNEGLNLLKTINKREAPESLVYKGYALVAQWNYRAAIPLFSEALSDPDPENRLIAKLNLAAALVHEGLTREAKNYLDELLSETSEHGFSQFQGNVFEISAQAAIQDGEFKKASELLGKSGTILKSVGGLDAFFVRKWKAVLKLSEYPSPEYANDLFNVREEAVERRHWESIRDCDYHLSRLLRDTERFTHLFFGTPFEEYRNRMLATYPASIDLPKTYLWAKGPRVSKILSLARFDDAPKFLRPGSLLQRLLCTLASDFYRPQRVATLFSQLYPDEYFNPVSSPARIHEAVKRLRQVLDAERFPLEIGQYQRGYFLEPEESFALEIPRSFERRDFESMEVRKLCVAFGTDPFTTVQASKELKVPPRSISRWIKHAEESGLLSRIGASSATKFRFKKSSLK